MEINIPDIVAEVKGAFEQYEAALITNNIAVLDELFWHSPHTVMESIKISMNMKQYPLLEKGVEKLI